MSNLNSKFDVYKGWPNGSALELSVHPAVASITEGKIRHWQVTIKVGFMIEE